MTCEEFSNGFDTLLNEHSVSAEIGKDISAQDIRVDEYEKSLFLTKAQEQLVLTYYNGNNSNEESFEQTEEVRRYLSKLVKDSTLSMSNVRNKKLSRNSSFYELPKDVWFIVYESLVLKSYDCKNNNSMDVMPVTHDEYSKLKNNPFRGANDRRALRLDYGNNTIEIICNKAVSGYYIRYLSKPEPIILVDLPDGLSIGGVSIAQTCKLHEALHERVLELAVRMVIASRGKANIKEERV